ncbi:hypothetical protein [Amycolatopsis dendrobii]|uniref:Uncharacterized protein n=1 Tax=Amycolatopsis dendrobii TaxID=2760662 RepID=A0A7W3VUL8_9PSEU|nr:hypothetical protein [Amycolatopsis dendrobii]MBB1153528.1 hypothetical protein [Amycolatopsis dendrobii]
MATWRVLIADTVTGTILSDVTPRDLPSFSRKVTDKGSWTVNVMPEDRANSAVDLHACVDAGRYTWIVACDDYICQAGPTFTYQYDENTRNLSVSGAGIQSLFDRRVLRNPAGPANNIVHVNNDLVLNGYTLRGIAREIVAANLAQVGYGLPIDVPAAEAGTSTRTYYGYDLATVWDRLNELSKVDKGPELDFRPYITPSGNQIRWELLIGSPKLGNQTSTSVWDYGGALGQIDVDTNGAASPCVKAWVRGSGTERTMLAGYASNDTLISLGYPPTDYVDNDHTSVVLKPTLDAYAIADLAQFSAPSETWKCNVRVDGLSSRGVLVSPKLGGWSPGDAPIFGVSGHPWIKDGQYRRRILGFSNDTESTVSLELQETLAVN